MQQTLSDLVEFGRSGRALLAGGQMGLHLEGFGRRQGAQSVRPEQRLGRVRHVGRRLHCFYVSLD
jgi:hypothetical protein